MKKAILLVRVSTLAQSLDEQSNDLKRKAQSDGYLESEIEIISDKESAIKLSDEERLGLNKMYNTIADTNNDIKVIYVWELSRLSRHQTTLHNIRAFLINKKINLSCLSPSFSLLKEDGNIDESGDLIFSLFCTMAESEMRNKKARFAKGKRENSLKNKYVGGTLQIGYNKDKDKNIVIEQSEKEIVLRIFRSYVHENKSLNRIATELNLEKVKTKTELFFKKHIPKNWTKANIKNILMCRWYVGERTCNNEIIKLPKHLIFSELNEFANVDTLFNEANLKLKQNFKSLKPRASTQILTGIIYCACGQRFYARNFGKDTSKIYSCYSNVKKAMGVKRICLTKGISVETFDKIIWNFLKFQFNLFFNKRIKENINNENNFENRKKDLYTLIEKANEEIEMKKIENTKFEKAKIKKNMDDSAFEYEIKENDNAINHLRKIINEYNIELKEIEIQKNSYNLNSEIQKNISEIEKDKALQKNYTKNFVKKITMYSDRNRNIICKLEFIDNRIGDYFIIHNTYLKEYKNFYFYVTSETNSKVNYENNCFAINGIKILEVENLINKNSNPVGVLISKLNKEKDLKLENIENEELIETGTGYNFDNYFLGLVQF